MFTILSGSNQLHSELTTIAVNVSAYMLPGRVNRSIIIFENPTLESEFHLLALSTSGLLLLEDRKYKWVGIEICC